jgi:hypothetical protein
MTTDHCALEFHATLTSLPPVLLLEKQKKNNLSVVTSASFLGDKVS